MPRPVRTRKRSRPAPYKRVGPKTKVRVTGKKRKSNVDKISAKRLKTIKAVAEKAIDKAIPDVVINTHKRVSYNSAISAGEQGYIFTGANASNIGALAIPNRLCLLRSQLTSKLVGEQVGQGIRCKSVRYHGEFHINPSVFVNTVLNPIQNFMVIVHCFILKDKFNPEGNNYRDTNCVADILLQPEQLFPNVGGDGAYDPAAARSQMIGFSGTILDEQLKINRNRFTVVKHKKWIIKSGTTGTSLDVDPIINTNANYRRKFSFKIPTPKILKWDRRIQDEQCNREYAQCPSNVGDPFVCWGYTPYPNGPEEAFTNLVVDHRLTATLEPIGDGVAQ